MKESFKNLIKAVAVTGLMVGGGTDAKSQIQSPVKTEQSEVKKIENPRLAEMSDANMPDGCDRQHLYAKINGIEQNIGSVFYLQPGSKARFISNDYHPDCIGDKPDFEAVENLVQRDGEKMVITFAGAYRSPSGNIEGIAYENGKSVGESTYSKWHGFVYMTSDGDLELSRMKDSQGNFNQAGADALVIRAKREGGSLYQQIPAIWNGEQKLKSSDQGTYEMRAICEGKNGEKFVINCAERMTQDQFLKMCLSLKDKNGNPAVYNLMLTDTGVCSLGAFRDKNQIAEYQNSGAVDFNEEGRYYHKMNDEKFKQTGFTNLVVLSQF